jgi:hypothetical protein
MEWLSAYLDKREELLLAVLALGSGCYISHICQSVPVDNVPTISSQDAAKFTQRAIERLPVAMASPEQPEYHVIAFSLACLGFADVIRLRIWFIKRDSNQLLGLEARLECRSNACEHIRTSS